ncbi:MAG TPA: cysteine desulfurase family protein [Acidimicrobiales bacterium]|nr:cysteine desulfurase family protein [Acidimicrobiales bacterium]
MTELIYLDHNATTPIAPEVLEAMLPYLRERFGNPSSDHVLGHQAHQAVETARVQVATLIGASPGEIIFTSGGTESNNLAIRGVAASAPPARRRIVTSQVEHPAVVEPCGVLELAGWSVTRVPVTPEGIVDAETAIGALDTDVALLTLMRAQNETGAIMPVDLVAAAAHPEGIIVHTDAAQAVGKIEVDVDDLGVDLLSIAGHKLFAPKGVGALYVREGTLVEPIVFGGGQERGLRPGTENVASIVGLGAAAILAGSRLASESTRLRVLREEFWHILRGRIPNLVRHTPVGHSLPNTLALSFPGVLGKDVLAAADGVLASTGSACHSGVDTPAETLLAMGVTPEVALGSVRLSLGHANTETELAAAADILVAAFDAASNR